MSGAGGFATLMSVPGDAGRWKKYVKKKLFELLFPGERAVVCLFFGDDNEWEGKNRNVIPYSFIYSLVVNF